MQFSQHHKHKHCVSKLPSYIDHIVIVALTLDIGVKYIYDNLGVMPQKGGEHDRMGTHNYLLKLGNSIYLEVIAVNPDSPKPGRPRWFALDKPGMDAKPKLLTWIVRTEDIKTAKQNSLIEFGNIENMNRADINWLITVPSDGSLPCDGVAPSLIQWQSIIHPAAKLPDLGYSLLRLEGCHQKAEAINTTLRSIDFEGSFSIKQSVKPSLVAYIQTPTGVCRLE